MGDPNIKLFEDSAEENGLFAIAYALLRVAEATNRIADQLKWLGNGDACTPMGAIEAYGKHIGEKMDELASAIRDGTNGS